MFKPYEKTNKNNAFSNNSEKADPKIRRRPASAYTSSRGIHTVKDKNIGDREINEILKIRERIDKEEAKRSQLADFNRCIIKICIIFALAFMTIFLLALAWYSPLFLVKYKKYEPKVKFIICLLYIISSVITALNNKSKIMIFLKKVLYYPRTLIIFGSIFGFLYFVTYFLNGATKIFNTYLLIIFLGIVYFVLLMLYKQIDELSKSDTISIVSLIIAVTSLILSFISILK